MIESAHTGANPVPPASGGQRIANISTDDFARLDEQACRSGLSAHRFLWRHTHQQAQRSSEPVTVANLSAMGELLSDLANPTVMGEAWS